MLADKPFVLAAITLAVSDDPEETKALVENILEDDDYQTTLREDFARSVFGTAALLPLVQFLGVCLGGECTGTASARRLFGATPMRALQTASDGIDLQFAVITDLEEAGVELTDEEAADVVIGDLDTLSADDVAGAVAGQLQDQGTLREVMNAVYDVVEAGVTELIEEGADDDAIAALLSSGNPIDKDATTGLIASGQMSATSDMYQPAAVIIGGGDDEGGSNAGAIAGGGAAAVVVIAVFVGLNMRKSKRANKERTPESGDDDGVDDFAGANPMGVPKGRAAGSGMRNTRSVASPHGAGAPLLSSPGHASDGDVRVSVDA